ncbi:MAG TPA: DUF58 domain-containing protein [Actinocrinis sp.]|nr:DUF58 domain-containing protein [Actinocrinis sp.]
MSGPNPLRLRSTARILSAGLTVRGRAFLSSGIASAVCGILLGYQALIRVSVLLIALPLVAMTVIAGSRYRIACRRSLEPARVTMGSQAKIELRLENTARLPSAPLLVEDQVPYAFGTRPRFVLRRIQPGAARTLVYRVRSDSRGRFPIGPLSLHSADPLGLFEMTRSFTTRQLLTVAPRTEQLSPITLGTVWSGRGDGHAAHTAAAGEDDVGVREYRHGDELRRIHWPATAHHGEIMVRREEQTWHSRATVLLDCRSGAHNGDGPNSSFEWAVSAAASTACYLLRSGYTVQLATGVGSPSIPLDSEDAALESLALIQPVHVSALRIEPGAGEEIGESLVVAFLGTLGDVDTAFLSRTKPAGAGALAFVLDTPTWSASALRTGAGTGAGPGPRRGWGDVDLARDQLANSGWRVLQARAGDRFGQLWQAASRRTETEYSAFKPAAAPAAEYAAAVGATANGSAPAVSTQLSPSAADTAANGSAFAPPAASPAEPTTSGPLPTRPAPAGSVPAAAPDVRPTPGNAA